eukprot:m.261231 g.261231  ORF g.261231 m.261231 type:complete len:113 (+) comp41651_c0_seq1:54-392(+)
MTDQSVAPFATDNETGKMPKEYTFGAQKRGDCRPDPSTVAPWIAKEDKLASSSNRTSASYGQGAQKAVPYSKATAKLGDSGGKTPWATSESEVPQAVSPTKKREEAPFATGY